MRFGESSWHKILLMADAEKTFCDPPSEMTLGPGYILFHQVTKALCSCTTCLDRASCKL
jgi:hypothetical protein